MSRFRILPYRQGSRGARALAAALPGPGRVLRLRGSTFRPRRNDVIINWGNTENPRPAGVYTFLNPPEAVQRVSNKLNFFRTISDARLQNIIPRFWTRRGDIPDDAFPIVCRTILAGHSGAGIVIAQDRQQLVEAPLYVEYIKKQDEYRVHLGRYQGLVHMIAVQRKARREGFENPNWQVRNHNNGFVFVRGGVNPPEAILEVARQAFRATGLDFGAVDVIFNQRQGRAYVLEINSAPGLEGQTVEDYATFFARFRV